MPKKGATKKKDEQQESADNTEPAAVTGKASAARGKRAEPATNTDAPIPKKRKGADAGAKGENGVKGKAKGTAKNADAGAQGEGAEKGKAQGKAKDADASVQGEGAEKGKAEGKAKDADDGGNGDGEVVKKVKAKSAAKAPAEKIVIPKSELVSREPPSGKPLFKVRSCTLQRTAATHCSTLQHTATRCQPLQNAGKYCNTLHHVQYAEIKRNTRAHLRKHRLQNIATHCTTCNILQLTARKEHTCAIIGPAALEARHLSCFVSVGEKV